MIFLRYARNRLRAFLDQIQRLLDLEFPYPQSSEAIKDLEQSFKAELHVLDSFSEHSDAETVKQECVLALSLCFDYLPVLGFLLRSTNVRNAFEAFWPLFRLAREALEPAVPEKDRLTRLVLSSEWDYSPLTYPSIQHLPSFVLIGLPAPESENPLLLPLAGHELGHSLWLKEGLKNTFLAPIKTAIIESM